MRFPPSRCAAAALLFATALLAGCGVGQTKPVVYAPEAFRSTDTHTRSFNASEAQTCEAARRALLSQGYMIATAASDAVVGRKSFQPESEVHVEVEFRVVCAREANRADGSRSSIAFASALQDRYAIKKVNNAASVGVGAIGSLSLPFSSSDDAMVKVASETLTDDRLYERFFALLDRFMPEAIASMVTETPSTAASAAPSKQAAAPAQAHAPRAEQDKTEAGGEAKAGSADKADAGKSAEPPAAQPDDKTGSGKAAGGGSEAGKPQASPGTSIDASSNAG